LKILIFQKSDPQKGGIKSTKKYKKFLGNYFGPKCYFLRGYNIKIPDRTKSPTIFLHTVKKSKSSKTTVNPYQNLETLGGGKKKKKRVFFTTKIWTLIFFSLFVVPQSYLQGINSLKTTFGKKNYFWFF